MTALTDFCQVIRNWANFDHDDAVITSWVRIAEQNLSLNLRIADMLQIDTGTLYQRRVTLPSDWRELDFVRFADGGPIRYMSRDEFYRDNDPHRTNNFYTVTGNYIVLGGAVNDVDGRQLEVSYYGDLPALGNDPNWVVKRHSGLLIAATMAAGCLYDIEDSRLSTWVSFVDNQIKQLNDEHRISRHSGSNIVAQSRRSF